MAKRSLNLTEARQQNFIQKPMNLKEIAEKNLLDSTGKFLDPGSRKRLSLIEAIAEGFLDAEVRHIFDPNSKETIGISEALIRGILEPEGNFNIDLDGRGPQRLSLQQASKDCTNLKNFSKNLKNISKNF